jgi:GDP-4-dehydro-6-deoxy-D-mannose reductase
MRALITGVTGFVGGHLVDHLAAEAADLELWGLVWDEEPGQVPPSVRQLSGDLSLPSSLSHTLAAARPDIVFHLAGATSVASSWQQPDRSFQVNAVGTLNLLEALRSSGLQPTVVVASSAEVYGAVPPAGQPIRESAPLEPISPYAASKAAQDLIAAQYHRGFGLPTIRLRLFPHTGPRRPPQFALSSFARQIALIERGLEPPVLAVGNLEAIRDFTDVRDVARAYRLAAEKGRAGTAYNIGSGHGVSIRGALGILLGLSRAEIEVTVDPARLRAADVETLVADASSFRADTGWRAEIPLERTLGDLLDWWREQLPR